MKMGSLQQLHPPSSRLLLLSSNPREKYLSISLRKGSPSPSPSSSSNSSFSDHQPCVLSSSSFRSPLTKLEAPPSRSAQDKGSQPGGMVQDKDHKDDFYLNLGTAVRTLREDLPLLFSKDLNYTIYRDDITFTDPLNTFHGIENYKLIFWALRFHGRVLFREISLEVFRVWQPSENVILIRWNLRGVPRVPWEAKGQFQGTSRYKLDRNGKIYEHKIDNLAFNFPQRLRPAASVLDLVTACPPSPNLTFLSDPPDVYSSSWLEFYQAVRATLEQENYLLSQESLVTCS